jgi:hypothetical protein
MFRRVFACVLTALFSYLIAAADPAAASSPATSAPPAATRYSVYSRNPDATEWSDPHFYRTASEAAAAARRLHERGLEAQVYSWARMSHVPDRTKSKDLPTDETVTFKEAAQIFKWLATQHDIAYRFPADGCYARAYLMIRRMQNRGLTPFKVWSFANGTKLHVSTTNHPDGYVEWQYHTAPVLRVRFENDVQRWYVMDPALFRAPATIAQWREAQKKPGSRYTPYITLTRVGQAPKDAHGEKLPGSGYWPGPDPSCGVAEHARKTMRRYKPQEGHRPARAAAANRDRPNVGNGHGRREAVAWVA